MFQKNKLCCFSQILNFFNLSPHPHKTAIVLQCISINHLQLCFLSDIFFQFLGSAYPVSPVTCEGIIVRLRLHPKLTKQTIKRPKKHTEFFNDTEVFVLLFSDSPVSISSVHCQSMESQVKIGQFGWILV